MPDSNPDYYIGEKKEKIKMAGVIDTSFRFGLNLDKKTQDRLGFFLHMTFNCPIYQRMFEAQAKGCRSTTSIR